VDVSHLLRGKESASLELGGEGGEEMGIHATEAHGVVVADSSLTLFVGCLILEDRQESSLSPTSVGGEFLLQDLESVFLIHNTNKNRFFFKKCPAKKKLKRN